jgi:FkbM family methyltransferase
MSFAGRTLLKFNMWRESRKYSDLLLNGFDVYQQKTLDDAGLKDSIIDSLQFRVGPTFKVRDGAGAAHVFSEIFIRDQYPARMLSGARTIVDVGANIGLLSYYARRQAPQARIIAIEADPDTFAILNSNLTDQRVECFHQAVSSTPGTLDFYSSSTSGWSSLYPVMGAADGRKVSVRSEPLSTTLRACNIGFIDFLKVDVEGAEYDILLGDPPLWQTPIRHLVAEVDRAPRDERYSFDQLERFMRTKFKSVQIGGGNFPLMICSN